MKLLNAAAILTLLLVVVDLGCAPTPTAPAITAVTTPSSVPASIRLTAASRTDQQLDIVATVLTADGRGVPGVEVTFALNTGTLSAKSVTSDSTGRAATIAATPIATTVTAAVGAVTNSLQVPSSQTTTPALAIALSFSTAAGVSSPTAGSPVTLSVTMTSGGTASLTSVVWTFGDGTSATTTSSSTNHTYSVTGTGSVSATASDSLGRSATASVSITVVNPAALTVTVVGQTTATAGDTVTFAVSTFSPAPPVVVKSWAFGDTSSVVSTSQTPITHQYTTAATYTVQATVSDALGRTATGALTITVNAAITTTTTTGLSVSLTCTADKHGTATPTACNVTVSYNGTTLPSKKITKVDWDWGDGIANLDTLSPVLTHPYDSAGTYTIFATVTAIISDDGTTSTKTSSKTVSVL